MSDPGQAPVSDAAKRLLELKKKLLSTSKPNPPAATSNSMPMDVGVSPLPTPAPRPLTRTSEASPDAAVSQPNDDRAGKPKKAPLTLRSLMGQKKKRSSEGLGSTPIEPAKKEEPQQPTPVVTGSRLKEAPAHRALMAESKTSQIRTKVISLTKNGVAEKIAHFEQNPPAALSAAGSSIVNPFAVLFNPTLAKPAELPAFVPLAEPKTAVELYDKPLDTTPEGVSSFTREHRVWLKRTLRESGITVPAYSDKKQKVQEPLDVTAFIAQHRKFLDALIAIK